MKKINLKARKHWDIYAASNIDLLPIGAVLSASGTDWFCVETQTPDGYSICNTIRVVCGKKKAAKLQKLIDGMHEVGVLKGAISYEVYPHR